MSEQPQEQIQYFTGIVKQVQDGGFITVRGQPRNGPPPERTIALSEIDAIRLILEENMDGLESDLITRKRLKVSPKSLFLKDSQK